MKRLLLLSAITLTVMLIQAQVTYTVTVPSGTNACYIAGDMNNWTLQEMTRVDATTFTITIPTATTLQGYKYTSGPTWGYVEKQANCTSDVPNRTYSPNDVVACWAAVWVPDAPKVDVVIRVKVPASWTAPRIHYWGDMSSNWPGALMVRDGEWWTFTFNQISNINIIFNNGAGSQTANITNVTASTCYQVNDNNSFQVISCAPAPAGRTFQVTVPAGTNTCYIVGSMTNWNFVEMTRVNPTTYTITLENATGTDQYKYASGPGWAWEELQSDCNTTVTNRTHTPNDVVACWRAIFDPASVPQDYVFNVTVPAGTNKCFIVGNFNNWSTFVEMTKLTETTFTVTINTNAPNGYKFSSGPSWNYEELQANGDPVSNRNYNQENTVALWKAVYVPTTTALSGATNRTWVRSVTSGIVVEVDKPSTVMLYTLQGSLKMQKQVTKEAYFNQLPAGVYILRVNSQSYKAIVH